MADFSYEYAGQDMAPGRTVFEVVNSGTVVHELVMFALPEDLPPIAEQLAGTTRRVLDPVASITNRGPGTSSSMAVDLVPDQRYAFICFLFDDGQHLRKGMVSEFRTAPAPVG